MIRNHEIVIAPLEGTSAALLCNASQVKAVGPVPIKAAQEP
jgi:hypothetical protein